MPKLKYLALKEGISAPSAGAINAQTTLGAERTGQERIEMYYPDKDWPACVVVKSNGETVSIPLANVRSMTAMKE